MLILASAVARSNSKSLVFDLTTIGLGSLLGAFLLSTSYLLQRYRTASWDDVNPLNTDPRSNLKRAYRASALLNWPMYFALGFAIIGVVLLCTAGVLLITS